MTPPTDDDTEVGGERVLDSELLEPVEAPLYCRLLPGGEYEITVWPISFRKFRICYGPAGEGFFDHAYWYPDLESAVAAAKVWDGQGDPPVGWTRHPQSGRRREDGDPAREEVRW